MSNVKKYRRQVRRQLRCFGKKKHTLLQKLDGSLALIETDDEMPTWDDLIQALGSPEEMALSLSSELTDKDRKKYRRILFSLRFVCIALIAALVIFAYLHIKIALAMPFVFEDTIIIYEAPPSS